LISKTTEIEIKIPGVGRANSIPTENCKKIIEKQTNYYGLHFADDLND
jgi:hypothetical protein